MGISLVATAAAMADNDHKGSKSPNELHFVSEGLPEGLLYDIKVGSQAVNTTIENDSNRTLKLKNLRPGEYKVDLYEVFVAGYKFIPKKQHFDLQLTKAGEIYDKEANRILKKPVKLNYDLKATPTATSTDPIYPSNTAGLSSCDPIIPNACTLMDTAAQIGQSKVVVEGNGLVYTTNGRYIYKCNGYQYNSCLTLDDAGKTSPIVSLIYANNRLYAGLNNGILWRCDPNSANSCTNLDDAGNNTSILSLAYGNNRLYAGLSNNIIWSCDPNNPNQCNNLDTAGGEIAGLAFGEGRLFAGVNDNPGTLWTCDPLVANSCQTLDTSFSSYTSMIYANSQVYAGLSTQVLLGCSPTIINGCTNFSGGHLRNVTPSSTISGSHLRASLLPIFGLVYQDSSARLFAQIGANLLSCDPITFQCITLD
jgi:hypothetical protein